MTKPTTTRLTATRPTMTKPLQVRPTATMTSKTGPSGTRSKRPQIFKSARKWSRRCRPTLWQFRGETPPAPLVAKARLRPPPSRESSWSASSKPATSLRAGRGIRASGVGRTGMGAASLPGLMGQGTRGRSRTGSLTATGHTSQQMARGMKGNGDATRPMARASTPMPTGPHMTVSGAKTSVAAGGSRSARRAGTRASSSEA
mmetsp:Transcript_47679/g.137249  ORF Transcript_47679/g.137249 Transcript_47679/m.137249 type:complete len:202 (+) Transcript_47679:379-984(+)